MTIKSGTVGFAPISGNKMPEIPKGAVAIGAVKKGSVIYQLPPFSRYLVFHETEIPKVITYDGLMADLDVDHPHSVVK